MSLLDFTPAKSRRTSRCAAPDAVGSRGGVAATDDDGDATDGDATAGDRAAADDGTGDGAIRSSARTSAPEVGLAALLVGELALQRLADDELLGEAGGVRGDVEQHEPAGADGPQHGTA